MGTAQGPQQQQQSAAAEPRAGTTGAPTPTQHEIDAFRVAQASSTLPAMPWHLKADGSAVDPQSFNASQGTPTWP
jgi:hypothetical protein